MNVTTHWANRPEQPLTSPFPVKGGWFVAVRSGDLCSPDDWEKPVHVRRARVLFRPFLSYRRGSFGFYVGWKAYGADNEDLKSFPSINPHEVYVGSAALQGFTWRFSRSLGPTHE